MRYRAKTRMSLRQSPDPKSPKYNEWHVWEEGEVFTPPKHLDIESALRRESQDKNGNKIKGLMEEVREGQGPAPVIKRGDKG